MLTFPAFADLSLWLHPSAMRLFFSGHCKLWGAHLLSVNPWPDLPLLETQPPSAPHPPPLGPQSSSLSFRAWDPTGLGEASSCPWSHSHRDKTRSQPSSHLERFLCL